MWEGGWGKKSEATDTNAMTHIESMLPQSMVQLKHLIEQLLQLISIARLGWVGMKRRLTPYQDPKISFQSQNVSNLLILEDSGTHTCCFLHGYTRTDYR